RHAGTAKAMDYMLKRWPAFVRFLDDGRICLTNNAAERALRGLALGRRAWLFAGSDRGGERAGAMYSLITTAKLNDVDPQPGSPTCCAGSTITQPRGSTSCSPGIGKAGLPDWLHKRCLRGGDHGKRIEGIQASRCVGEQRIQLSRAVPGGTAQALYPAPRRSCRAQELRRQSCSGFARWSVI